MPPRKDSKSLSSIFLFRFIYNSNILSTFTHLKTGALSKGNNTLGRSTVIRNQFSAETSFTILNQFHTMRQPYDQMRQKKIPCGDVALIKGTSFARKDSFIMAVRGFLTRKKIALDKQFCQNCMYHIVMTGALIYFVVYCSVAPHNKRKYQGIYLYSSTERKCHLYIKCFSS